MRLSALAVSLTVVAACAAPPSRAELTTLNDLAQLPGAALAEAEQARDGVVVGLHFDEPGARYDGFLWEAANAGADAVSLVWSWQQVDVHASEVERRSAETPADTEIVEAAQLATRLGLEVLMLPFVRLDTIERGAWRGTLAPEDREEWWASYEAFILHNAALAERAGAAWFVVGSELGSMEDDVERWRALISRVREVTRAQLTYSANWDRVHHVRFWDALDAVGLTGYFELTDADAPLDELALAAAWRPIVQSVDELAAELEKPVIVTEVGYTSQRGAAAHPWDYTLGRERDLIGQQTLYTALARAWSESARLEAIYLWDWFGVGGGRNDEYTPRQKPAERVVRAWYQGQRPSASPP